MNKKAFSVVASFALASFIAMGSANAASTTHSVKTGDTLWKIASHYKLSVDELRNLNNMTSDSIKLNQKLVVAPKPKSSASSSKPVNKATNVTTSVKSSTYASAKSEISKAAVKVASVPVKAPSDPTISVVATALPLLDTPYVWAGVTTDGFDCSGFIYYTFNKAGLKMPRWDTISMFNNSYDVVNPIPGDIVFFENTYRNGISHAGIYLGNRNFIHAGAKKVEITSLDSVYWKDKFTGFKRFNGPQK